MADRAVALVQCAGFRISDNRHTFVPLLACQQVQRRCGRGLRTARFSRRKNPPGNDPKWGKNRKKGTRAGLPERKLRSSPAHIGTDPIPKVCVLQALIAEEDQRWKKGPGSSRLLIPGITVSWQRNSVKSQAKVALQVRARRYWTLLWAMTAEPISSISEV